ncbi:hypothetical protein MPTK1_5g11740 [Marchantia polymorpha subsp. ruderalis]|uniref:Uncharacterized protein n=2 Tax=Marchantia polymorpha TaxID=3197 RepID=A0AAF6BHD7_MARPO|nr:hypothetical protein MARPO_0143s0003 [Marchantia polymorpha]BBN11421.1 hypothetical protein Mp_5g11740 [Marchantia polymorpha subsp. ruderalis]|eukprot:PTQ29320.1 hypothetical protein MARPO_0143s0003 [Marchantia polymorpha]
MSMGRGRSQGANWDTDERAIHTQRSRMMYNIRPKYSGMPRRINSENSCSGPPSPPSTSSAASSVDTRSSFLDVGQEFVGTYYDGLPVGAWSVKLYIRGSDVLGFRVHFFYASSKFTGHLMWKKV